MIGRPDREVAAHVAVNFSDLAPASALLGQTVQGSAELSVTVSGTEDRPRVRIEASGGSLRIGGTAAAQGRAQAAVSWSAKPADPAARLLIAADGELLGLALPEGVPRSLGRDLRWSLSASAKPDFSLVELGDFTARGAGIDIAGSGRIAERGDAIDGKMRLVVAELGAFSGFVGHRIGGRLSLDVTAEQQGGDRVLAKIDGSVANLDTGVPAVNALAGRSVAIAGSAERDRGGIFRLDRLAADRRRIRGRRERAFRSGAGHRLATLAGRLDADIRDLRRAATALGMPVAGRIAAAVTVEGPAAHPRLQARLDGRDLRAGAASLDQLRLDAKMADAMQPRAAIEGDFRGHGLDGRLSLTADAGDAKELMIRGLQLKAAGGVIDADLRVDRRTLLARGRIEAKLPDLSPWSRVAGVPLSGRLDATAGLDIRGRAGRRAESDRGAAVIRRRRVPDGARPPGSDGAARRPAGDAVRQGPGKSDRRQPCPGCAVERDGDARQPEAGPLRVPRRGQGQRGRGAESGGRRHREFAPQTGAVELRVARLDGALGPDRFRLNGPLAIARQGDDLALSGLAASFGRGRISGHAARRGNTLSLLLAAQDLPAAAIGQARGLSTGKRRDRF